MSYLEFTDPEGEPIIMAPEMFAHACVLRDRKNVVVSKTGMFFVVQDTMQDVKEILERESLQ